MTNDRNKIYWHINFIIAAIILLVLTIIFCYRYFVVKFPVNDNWTEEICMYLFMWLPICVVVCGACYAPIRALADKIAKNRGAKDESM